MFHVKHWLALTSSALTGLIVAGVVALAAPPGVINAYNAICDPNFATRCISVDTNGAIQVTGGGGGGGSAQLKATAADPTYVEGSTTNPLSSDLSGYMRVLAKQGTTPWIVSGAVTQSGIWTVQQGGSPWGVTGSATATDAATLTGALKTWDILGGYNGTTVDLIRAGDVNNVASAIGDLDVLPVARYNATLPTLTDTRYDALQTGLRGGLHVDLYGADSASGIAASANQADGVTNSVISLFTMARGAIYNGTTWDRYAEVANGTNSAGVGIPASGQLGQCDDVSPAAITENQFGNVRIDCTNHAQYVETLPSAAAAAGIAPVVSASLETGHVLKAGAGNLYGVEVTTTGVAGYLDVFNSTTVPAAGAVSPVAHCYVVAFGTCGLQFSPPMTMTTGISVAFTSAVTPFTKTDSPTAAFSGQVQ